MGSNSVGGPSNSSPIYEAAKAELKEVQQQRTTDVKIGHHREKITSSSQANQKENLTGKLNRFSASISEVAKKIASTFNKKIGSNRSNKKKAAAKEQSTLEHLRSRPLPTPPSKPQKTQQADKSETRTSETPTKSSPIDIKGKRKRKISFSKKRKPTQKEAQVSSSAPGKLETTEKKNALQRGKRKLSKTIHKQKAVLKTALSELGEKEFKYLVSDLINDKIHLTLNESGRAEIKDGKGLSDSLVLGDLYAVASTKLESSDPRLEAIGNAWAEAMNQE